MARSCAIIPKVKNDEGQIVDSRLFKDLLKFTSNNRNESKRLYTITKSNQFINNWNSRVELDKNGEPTLISLLEKTNLKEAIPEKTVLDTLNKQIGHYKKNQKDLVYVPYTESNYSDLKRRAITFNNTSDFKDNYVAVVNKVQPESHNYVDTKLNIEVQRKNNENALIAKKMEKNEALNEKLRTILQSMGVSVGVLTDAEERAGLNGVTDFDQAQYILEGTVELIRLAHGERGEQALPEEFAHFALEALGNNPLANRLITLLNNNPALVSEILGDEYDTYKEEYKDDTVKLATEAAGKLLAKHLLQAQKIPQKSYKTLLERLIDAIKKFFSRMDASQLQRARYEADKEFGQLATQLLVGELTQELNIGNIKSREKYYSLKEKVDRDKKILQNIIKIEQKRKNVYSPRAKSKEFSKEQAKYIETLESLLEANKEIEGINLFMDTALTIFKSLNTRLETVNKDKSMSLSQKAEILRDIKNYVHSYKSMIGELRAAIIEDKKLGEASRRYEERAKNNLDTLTTLIADMETEYMGVAFPMFADFMRPFLGEKLVVPFGKNKGKVLTIEDLIKEADKDISFFDRWLDSMADSSDYMLKLFDQAVKIAKEKARMEWVKLSKDIKAAGVKLERAGINNFEWMFERDDEGNLTGNYVTPIKEGLFKKNKDAMLKRLKEKYGDEPKGKDLVKYNAERNSWNIANMEKDGSPKRSIYGNKTMDSWNYAQREFYKTIMEIKHTLDSYLPEGITTLNNAVKIRKDLIERVRHQGLNAMVESIKDSFLRRSDDTEFGTQAALQDFEGNRVETLPIFYTKLREEQKDKDGKIIRKAESPNDMSTDVVSTMVAYAQMALDYREMDKIIDVLELGRDLMRERKIQQTQSGKPLVETVRKKGKTLFNKLTKQGEATHFMQRLNDFFQMQVYGRYISDEGSLLGTNIDFAKTIDNWNALTALNTLALNLLSGISNVETGKVMMRIESFSKEYFTETNTLHADRNYAEALPEYMAEIGKRVKTSKLALWTEYFNVLQDFEQEARGTNWDRKSRFAQLCESDTLFFMQNAGEHWMQTRTSLALADNYKMKAPDGSIVSLWDAMEVVPLDKKDSSLGARLQLKEGYTKEDGSEFTQFDVIRFSRRSAAINQRMHGIYNYLDRSAIQKLALGRAGILFRKWIKPSLNRRFGGITYNFDLDAWVEGYYRTAGRFLRQMSKDLRRGQISITAHWNELTNTEKANIRRCLTEVGHFLLICAVLGILGSIKYKEWPKDKNWERWAFATVLYQAKRLQTEIGMFIPGNPFMLNEALTILKSPMAGVKTMESMLSLIYLMDPTNYELFAGEDAIIKSGKFKGKSRAVKYLLNSPLAPMYRTIQRAVYPEESMKVFDLFGY